MSAAQREPLPPVRGRAGRERRYWRDLARHTPLGVVCDLDGTLLSLTSTPDQTQCPPELAALLAELTAMPGMRLVVGTSCADDRASGAPRETCCATDGVPEPVPARRTRVRGLAAPGWWEGKIQAGVDKGETGFALVADDVRRPNTPSPAEKAN